MVFVLSSKLRHAHLAHRHVGHVLHHLTSLLKLLKQTVYLLNVGTATLGNTLTAAAVDSFGMATLLGSH